MVAMRPKKRVQTTHEPWLVWSPAVRRLERLGPAEAGTPSCQRFMVAMRGIKVVEATHEPLFRSAGCQPAACLFGRQVSPIANRRGVGTSNGQRVGNPRYSRHGCLRYGRGATRRRAGGRRSFAHTSTIEFLRCH